MATRYLLKINPLVLSEDIPTLPEQLQIDFLEVFQPILQTDPHEFEGFPWHSLKGDLAGYRALEVEWEGNPNAYRLVYRIYEKPAPRRILIISFAEHDPAYEKAKNRASKKDWIPILKTYWRL